jgi:hypothetical protein
LMENVCQLVDFPVGIIPSDWLPIQSKSTCLLRSGSLESWSQKRKVRHSGDSAFEARLGQF